MSGIGRAPIPLPVAVARRARASACPISHPSRRSDPCVGRRCVSSGRRLAWPHAGVLLPKQVHPTEQSLQRVAAH